MIWHTIYLGLQLLLEYLRVLAWPITLLLSIYLFRKNIAALIDRVQKLTWRDASAVLAASKRQDAQLRAEQKPAERAESTELTGAQKKIVTRTKRRYQAELKAQNRPQTRQLQQLADDLALTQMNLEFERLYHNIFGSQILLLMQIRAQKSAYTNKQVEEYFASVRDQFEPQFPAWTLDQYLSLLRKSGLITTNEGVTKLTDKAEAFLSYIAAEGYSFDK